MSVSAGNGRVREENLALPSRAATLARVTQEEPPPGTAAWNRR